MLFRESKKTPRFIGVFTFPGILKHFTVEAPGHSSSSPYSDIRHAQEAVVYDNDIVEHDKVTSRFFIVFLFFFPTLMNLIGCEI